MSETLDRRQYDRFSSSLAVEVSTFNDSGEPMFEKTFLRDVSGSGISFVCANPDHYSFGQSLDIIIYSNQEDTLESHDVGSGKAMWVNEADNESPAWVGVMLDNLLSLENLNLQLVITSTEEG
ncbi:MAG: PilZ domain-containing protein [Mariprofundaceae bacterium]